MVIGFATRQGCKEEADPQAGEPRFDRQRVFRWRNRRRFMGRDPELEPLLVRSGLAEPMVA
jgi:hypothetical protein